MSFIKSKKGTAVIVISGIFTALICGIMNFLLIPIIESDTNGIRCFDMNFAYSFEEAKKFLSLLSERGREVYLGFQLPLDFLYPFVYAVFFFFIIARLTKRVLPLCLLPIILALTDYTENICTLIILKASELSKALASFSSVTTSVKTVLMYTVFAVIIVCAIYRATKRRNV